MKSQIIFQNKIKVEALNSGFLTYELLFAIALFSMLFPAILDLSFSSKSLKAAAINKLNEVSSSTIILNGAYDSVLKNKDTSAREFGKSTCLLSSSRISSAQTYVSNISLGTGIVGTSLTARNGYIYQTGDSSTQSKSDFFIIDARTPGAPYIASSLHTGPGLAAIAIAGEYAFVANESSISQLQVISIADRTRPTLIAQLKLPLPDASSTAPRATSIYYQNGFIYIGTEKWAGTEFNIIDVSDPRSPHYVQGFETDAQVNSIRVHGTHAYVATVDTQGLLVLDIHNPNLISKVSSFSPSGSAVLQGKALEIEDPGDIGTNNGTSSLIYGRNGGGFNNSSQYEFFTFDLNVDPLVSSPFYLKDIPGGVYGLVFMSKGISEKAFVVATGDSSGYVQFLSASLPGVLSKINLPFKPTGLACDHDRLYLSFSNEQGFAIITL
jgi:hypothetical protein